MMNHLLQAISVIVIIGCGALYLYRRWRNVIRGNSCCSAGRGTSCSDCLHRGPDCEFCRHKK